MNKKILLDAMVELVTVNGRPITIVSDSGIRKLVDPIINGLKTKISITPRTVKTSIIEEANKIRCLIGEEVKNKLISLKVDAVTRLDRAFLGINIQYYKNNKIVLRTLSLNEIKESHTGEHIKEIIQNVVNKFNININQIYTVTTDNGANMLKAINKINCDMESFESNFEEDENVFPVQGEENFSGDDDNEEQIIIKYVDDDEDVGSSLSPELIMEKVDNALDSLHNDDLITKWKIIGMRCAAHTLQLAIEDSLKQSKSELKLIEKCRQMVRQLRNQNNIYLIRSENLNKPILDCATRWTSTIEMLLRLLSLKNFCKDLAKRDRKFKSITITENEWTLVEKITEILTPLKICVKQLQEEQLTLGDLLEVWISCKLKIEKFNTPFSMIIYSNMNKREKRLFENDVFVSAIFMDPRYKILLSSSQVQQAIQHLQKVWFHYLKQNRNLVPSKNQELIFSKDLNTEPDNNEDEFDEMLKQKENEQAIESEGYDYPADENNRMLIILEDYNKRQGRISRKSNIFQFWESQKALYPELYYLATMIHTVPATQVSVERLFSGLKFILSPLRTNIKDA